MKLATDAELASLNQEGKLPARYLAEVALHTDRRVREYAAAERRMESARKRHANAVAHRDSATGKRLRTAQAEVDRLWDLVEERVRELRVLAALMTEVPASAAHRGTTGVRHRSGGAS